MKYHKVTTVMQPITRQETEFCQNLLVFLSYTLQTLPVFSLSTAGISFGSAFETPNGFHSTYPSAPGFCQMDS